MKMRGAGSGKSIFEWKKYFSCNANVCRQRGPAVPPCRIRQSQKLSTFCCYLDVRKAYDTVWRELLWKKLRGHNIKGPFLQSIINLYDGTTSSAKTFNSTTSWFPISVGVRQGDVLSPFLYAIFINPIIEKINALGLGVLIGNIRVSLLLYADDIVLIAESTEDLPLMINAAETFGQENAFIFNAKKTKAQLFFPRPRQTCKVSIYGECIENVTEFRYLGIIFKSNLSWKDAKHDLLQRSFKALRRCIPLDRDLDFLSVTSWELIYKAKVRSVVEYCASVIGTDIWPPAESLQIEAARRILLLVGTKTANDVILGDLGWMSLRARRDELHLRYWCRAVHMPDHRLVRQIYLASRYLLLSRGPTLKKTWVASTWKLLLRHGVNSMWDDSSLASSSSCAQAVLKTDADAWRSRIRSKSKLQWYFVHKQDMHREPFLDLVKNPLQRRLLLRLRASNYMIRVEYGRIDRIAPNDRTCLLCCCGDVETESHFVTRCAAFSDLRQAFQSADPSFSFRSPKSLPMMLCVPAAYESAWLLINGCESRESFLRRQFIRAGSFLMELDRQRNRFRFMEAPFSMYCKKHCQDHV